MRPRCGASGLSRVVAAFALALCACAGPMASPGGRPVAGDGPAFARGMVFGLFAREDPEHETRAIAEMKALGVNSVSIMIPWVVRDVRSIPMAPRPDMTPSDESIVRTVRAAHREGMSVLLMPFLFVDEMAEDEWRGTIDPPDWDAWFGNYRAFVLRYAALAGREAVEYFSVGSELCSTERRREDWRRVIREVRAVFPGRVTYSANWDHRDAISFVEDLDVLGLNAYFRLSDAPDPTEDQLVAAWQPIREEIGQWSRRLGKRILFTEVGYPSRVGASIDPWNYDAGGDPAPDEQLRCYRAFRLVWGGDPRVEGVYFYHWWGRGGPEDTGYTPRGKPAENVVREWYSR